MYHLKSSYIISYKYKIKWEEQSSLNQVIKPNFLVRLKSQGLAEEKLGMTVNWNKTHF
jgi:hypothetical protein